MAIGKLEFILFIGEEAVPVTEAEIIILNTDTSQIVNNKVLKVDKNGKSKRINLWLEIRYEDKI